MVLGSRGLNFSWSVVSVVMLLVLLPVFTSTNLDSIQNTLQTTSYLQAFAQTGDLDMELTVTDEEKIIIFSGFAAVTLGVFLFLARDIILRKKTTYDTEEYASKKDRTYEKYHSEWGDDYEEIGTRKRSKAPGDLFDIKRDGKLLDYYKILDVRTDATSAEIKDAFRRLAKSAHPDRAGLDKDTDSDDLDKRMADINKAYEVLSDEVLRKKYDSHVRNSADDAA